MTIREEILENCKWIFGQEVKIITFFHEPTAAQPGGWRAVVVRKSCTAQTMKMLGDDQVLIRAISPYYVQNSEKAIEALHLAVGTRIGKILSPVDAGGVYRVNNAAIPALH